MANNKTQRSWTPSVLVVEEKHGTYYYDATTREAFHEAALALLVERFNQGYWYNTPEQMYDDESKWEKNILTKIVPGYDPDADAETRKAVISTYRAENIESIKDEEARALVAGRLNQAIKRQKDKRKYAEWYKELERVIEEKDAASAWGILDDRSDHEYEGVELETLRRTGE